MPLRDSLCSPKQPWSGGSKGPRHPCRGPRRSAGSGSRCHPSHSQLWAEAPPAGKEALRPYQNFLGFAPTDDREVENRSLRVWTVHSSLGIGPTVFRPSTRGRRGWRSPSGPHRVLSAPAGGDVTRKLRKPFAQDVFWATKAPRHGVLFVKGVLSSCLPIPCPPQTQVLPQGRSRCRKWGPCPVLLPHPCGPGCRPCCGLGRLLPPSEERSLGFPGAQELPPQPEPSAGVPGGDPWHDPWHDPGGKLARPCPPGT